MTTKQVIRKTGLHKVRCGEIVKILKVEKTTSTGIAYVPVRKNIYRHEYRTWQNDGPCCGRASKSPWDVIGAV